MPILLQALDGYPMLPFHPASFYFESRPASRLISSRRASVSCFDALAAAAAAFFFRSSSSLTTIQTDQDVSIYRQSSNRTHSLGLSDLEYSFNRVTKSSNSCCRSSRFSKLFFRSSGLYLDRSSSSVGVNHMVKAGPPTATTAPLVNPSVPAQSTAPLSSTYPSMTLVQNHHLDDGFFGAMAISAEAVVTPIR